MATVELYDKERRVKGTVELPEAVFGAPVKPHLLHHVVVAQLAARRAGTASTKIRSEVSGGGKKPFRQKGTGRARMGSTRSPLLRGGGVIFGPRPRSFEKKVNRKEMKAALRCALSAKAGESKLLLVEDLDLSAPRTKEFLEMAGKLGLSEALLVTDGRSENLDRGIRNLSSYKSIPVEGLNVYDILSYDQLVLSRQAFEKISEVLGT
ncbi:MAG TPA: 50S ribosomal protein L4 [Deltaproteobacteria bacterium]|nr:MAG: 50S ribosomal protein L4 [Deltaproteobacteria bacterium GWC2_65_14]HBO69085.1 50S ribosomal protein L4 [Deltaproteobacteria bacterium]